MGVVREAAALCVMKKGQIPFRIAATRGLLLICCVLVDRFHYIVVDFECEFAAEHVVYPFIFEQRLVVVDYLCFYIDIGFGLFYYFSTYVA